MSPTRPSRAWSAVGAALLALAAAGCGIFDPADPLAPGGGPGSIRFPFLESPDSVMFSLEKGIELRSTDLYMHAITESSSTSDVAFHAFFDPQDLLDFQTSTGANPPSDWRANDERTFFGLFLSLRPVTYDVRFTQDPDRQDQVGPNEVTLFRRYRVWAAASPVAVGVADLVIRRVGVNNEWKLVLWTDRRDTTATDVRTMGRRRLDSRSQ